MAAIFKSSIQNLSPVRTRLKVKSTDSSEPIITEEVQESKKRKTQ